MTTINKEEIQKFSNLADEWWDVEGKFKPLHMFNPVRIEYISEKIIQYFNLKNKKTKTKRRPSKPIIINNRNNNTNNDNDNNNNKNQIDNQQQNDILQTDI